MRLPNMTAVPLVALFAMACGDATGISPDQLAGTWTATSFVFTNQTNATESVDMIALGASFALTIRADGTFTTTLVEPDGTGDVDSGTVDVTESILTIADSGQGSPTAYNAVRRGDDMTLTTSDEDFDFDGDGSDDLADLRIELHRN